MQGAHPAALGTRPREEGWAQGGNNSVWAQHHAHWSLSSFQPPTILRPLPNHTEADPGAPGPPGLRGEAAEGRKAYPTTTAVSGPRGQAFFTLKAPADPEGLAALAGAASSLLA